MKRRKERYETEYKKKNKLGICIAPTQPYWAALGGSRRVIQQTVNHNGHSRTATSRSQQQVKTKR
jgi:hypothetical protein